MSESHAAQIVVHRLFAEVYPDVAARTAATGFPRGPAAAIVPFDSTDVGKAVWQEDDGSGNHSFWALIDPTPTWLQFDGIGWAAALAAHAAAADPHTVYQKESEKGAANGYASLDAGGLIPITQLPALAINDTFPVASQAAMLALTAQRGDVAIRSDNGNSYILATDSPGTLGDWLQITISGGVPGSHASTHAIGGSDALEQDAVIEDVAGTTYDVVAADNGKTKRTTNGSAVTVTVPNGLGQGFNVMFAQWGDGQVAFTTSGGATINNRQSHTKIAGKYGVASLLAVAADTFVLGGDTAT